MLVLTRGLDESLILNNGEIELVVLGVKGNQVRIGIKAPRSVSVHRKEVYVRLQQDSDSSVGNEAA